MLQAMNTGHDGSMTTVHANTPRDALSRVEQMIGMSGIDIPARSARAQIASAINVVIQVARLADGRRKLVSLSEITGMEGEVVTMQEIFRFRQTGVSADGQVQGKFEATGIRPRFLDQVMAHGITLVGRPVPPRREVRRMNADLAPRARPGLHFRRRRACGRGRWSRWIASNRAEGKAINLRLKMIGRGRSHGETMNLLRRRELRRAGRPAAARSTRLGAQVRADADAGAGDDADRRG